MSSILGIRYAPASRRRILGFKGQILEARIYVDAMAWLRRILGLKSRVRVVGTDLNGNQYLETQPGGTVVHLLRHYIARIYGFR